MRNIHHAVFCSLVLLPLFQAEIYFSASSSRTIWAYVLPFIWGTHTKLKANYIFIYSNLIRCCYLHSTREDKELDRMVAVIYRILSTLNFFMYKICICWCLSQLFELGSFWKDLLAVFMLWVCSSLYWRGIKHTWLSQHLHLFEGLTQQGSQASPISIQGLVKILFTYSHAHKVKLGGNVKRLCKERRLKTKWN